MISRKTLPMKSPSFLVIRNPLSSAIVTLTAVILALSAWMAIHAAVAKDQQRWIQGEILHIKNAIDERFAMYTNSLIHARSFLLSQPHLDLDGYQKYVDHLELSHYYPGLQGLDFAAVSSPSGLPGNPKIKESNGPANAPELSGPLKDGFLYYLPVFENEKLKGYVFAPFRPVDLFNAIFGKPDFKHERVDFSVYYDSSSEHFYQRFPAMPPNRGAEISADMNLSGPLKDWRLHVKALPHAFPKYYFWFPDLVGLAFLFGAALIIYSIQRTSQQFMLEDEYKNRLIQSELRVRRYSDTMFRLNRSSKAIFSEINLDDLFKKIALVTADVTQMPQVAVFSQKGEAHDAFSLRYFYGDSTDLFQTTEVSLADLQTWLPGRVKSVLHSNSMGASLVSTRLFKDAPANWILIPITKRSEKPLGFIVAISRTPITVEDQTLTILEALSSQMATAVENSTLFFQAEEASRLKSAFLANMSHEIRTPLGAIIGYADILSRKKTGIESPEIAKNLGRNVEQVTRLIDDILDISKIEANKLVIVPQWIPLRSVFEEVLSLMRMKADEKNLPVELQYEGPIPKFVFCDGIRLKQILMNLVGNAIKFTEKGQVQVVVNYNALTSSLKIRVNDSGCGIPRSAHASLFQSFSQGDASATRKFGGTGLGLALSRRLARLLEGDVRLISSDLNQGTIFEATIKAPQNDNPGCGLMTNGHVANSEPTEREKALNDREILLVEDSQDNQDIFKFFLESAGAHVTVANTGLEALKSTEKQDFDLILMDIQIPELDGKETTKMLRKKGWAKPIFALTAHGLKEERDSIRAAGCDGQITKPVTGEQLVHQVSLALHF